MIKFLIGLQAAVFNASGRPARKPFMDLSEDDFTAGFEVGGYLIQGYASKIVES